MKFYREVQQVTFCFSEREITKDSLYYTTLHLYYLSRVL